MDPSIIRLIGIALVIAAAVVAVLNLRQHDQSLKCCDEICT
jgi:hypothetical protein